MLKELVPKLICVENKLDAISLYTLDTRITKLRKQEEGSLIVSIEPSKAINPTGKIPAAYANLINIFSKDAFNILLPY